MCVLALAIAAMVVLPSGASAFGISGFNYANSNGLKSDNSGATVPGTALQAGSHPNVSISFNRTGGESEDLKDVQLDLPTGVFADPENGNPKCTASQFAADTCPSNAQVGSVVTQVKALGLLDLTINGTIDVITPENNQVATLGLTLRPDAICIVIFCAQPNKIFLKTGITIRSFQDSGLRTYTPGTPRTAVIGIPLGFVTPTINGDITINSLALNFQSRYGVPGQTKQTCGWFSCTTTKVPLGSYFWRQTGSCLDQNSVSAKADKAAGIINNTAKSNITIVSYSGATASSSSSFTPTGCKSVNATTGVVTPSNAPFTPTIAFTPQNTSAGASTPVTFGLAVPEADSAADTATPQQALPKIVDLTFPVGSGLDLGALSGVTACTEDQLKASACPASSIIGTANAFSKYLPNPDGNPAHPGLAGNVYAMSIGNQIGVGVQVLGPRNSIVIFRGTLGTRGDANAGTGAVYATFDKIPQLPYASFSMTLAKSVYKNPVPVGCATGQLQTTTSTITGFDGSDSTNGAGSVASPTTQYAITNCPATPDTTITAGPSTTVPTSNTQPPFSFTSPTAGATFQCSMDNAAFAPCTSPYTPPTQLSGSAAGVSHTFQVRAVNAGLVDPSPASLTFIVSTTFTVTPNITTTSHQARAHPDLDANIGISGGNPKSIAITLPEGFDASLTAATPCDAAVAAAGNCTAASAIGTANVTASTAAVPTETGVGTLYLTNGPTAADAGGFSAKVQFSYGTLIAQAGAYLTNNGKNQTLEFRSIPQVINGNDATVTNITAHFNGATNALITNPSSCGANSGFNSAGKSYAGTDAGAANVAYPVTGCTNPPVTFSPTINQVLTNTGAAQTTGVTANLGLGASDSGIKTVRVNEAPAVTPYYNGFGTPSDQCDASAAPVPSSVFDPATCPTQSQVGTMTINTPLLPNPLVGKVYLIAKSPLPWLGVAFDAPGISVRLTGVTSTPQSNPACDPTDTDTNPLGCQTQISILFNNLPDVPMTGIKLVLDGPARTGVGGSSIPGRILVIAQATDTACTASSTANSTFTPFSGTGNVALAQSFAITGCTS